VELEKENKELRMQLSKYHERENRELREKLKRYEKMAARRSGGGIDSGDEDDDR
jgi:hypothetical protein